MLLILPIQARSQVAKEGGSLTFHMTGPSARRRARARPGERVHAHYYNESTEVQTFGVIRVEL